ncbi:MAG: acetate/propionate family kinase [bacterium]
MRERKILIANVGSTSFKYQLFSMPDEKVLAKGKVERVGSDRSPFSHSIAGRTISGEAEAKDHNAAIKLCLDFLLSPEAKVISSLEEIEAVGFKTVHGGRFTGVHFLTDEVLSEMERFSIVAPAHNTPYIKAIRIFKELLPSTPLIGVFEPHFHTTIPLYARVYGVPYEWYEKYGIAKYGFHGASHHYIAERTPQLIGKPKEELKIISCHLGGSSSLCAIKYGESIDTSMGFSAQSGVLNATRCGDLDVFIIPFLMREGNMSIEEICRELVKRGGLLGISGISGDMRDLLEATASGDERASLAIDSFCYGVKKYIGSYVAIMNGLDVLVFTGGIGEMSPPIREKICEDMDYLGIKLDKEKNLSTIGKEGIISPEGSRVIVAVIPTNEELIVARESLKLLEKEGG